MRNGQSFLTPRVVAGITAACVLIASVSIYSSRGNSFAFVSQPGYLFKPAVTNPEVLENWLPTNTYEYTIARIDDYLRAQNIPATSMTVQHNVAIQPSPSYNFNMSLHPQNQAINVGVTVSNSNGIISTAVSIDGQAQQPGVSSPQNGAGTHYSGFDNLINAGLAATQSDELEQALQAFAPTANTITIDGSSVVSGDLIGDTTTRPFTFTITIDGKRYNATLNAVGLLQAELFLRDPSANDRQVFDSGTLGQGS